MNLCSCWGGKWKRKSNWNGLWHDRCCTYGLTLNIQSSFSSPARKLIFRMMMRFSTSSRTWATPRLKVGCDRYHRARYFLKKQFDAWWLNHMKRFELIFSAFSLRRRLLRALFLLAEINKNRIFRDSPFNISALPFFLTPDRLSATCHKALRLISNGNRLGFRKGS